MSETARRWRAFLHHAKVNCSPVAFANWLEPIRSKESDGEILELEVPNIYVQEYLLNNFSDELREFFGAALPINFTVARLEKPTPVQSAPKRPKKQRLNLNHLYTFDHFIEGAENTFIKSCAQACAKEAGTLYNPLFIYAPAGLGKTHLLHAIAAKARELRPLAKIECMTTEGFITELVENLKNKTVDRMKRRLRSLDILLIDDIQFLQNRLNFEEELIHTIEALLVSGGQVVITCDCAPNELKLSERIRGRFEGGLVAPVVMPGPETRAAILQHKAALRAVDLPHDVALFLSDRPFTSVRALEGIVNRLCAHVQITKKTITKELATQLASDLLPEAAAPKMTLTAILEQTAEHFNISVDEIKGKSRTAHLAAARSVAMHLAKSLIEMPLTAIASAFNRSHSTLLWACEKVEEQKKLKEAALTIRSALGKS